MELTSYTVSLPTSDCADCTAVTMGQFNCLSVSNKQLLCPSSGGHKRKVGDTWKKSSAGASLGFPKANHKITPRGKCGRSLGLAKLPKIWGSPLIFQQRPHCPLSSSGASCGIGLITCCNKFLTTLPLLANEGICSRCPPPTRCY